MKGLGPGPGCHRGLSWGVTLSVAQIYRMISQNFDLRLFQRLAAPRDLFGTEGNGLFTLIATVARSSCTRPRG